MYIVSWTVCNNQPLLWYLAAERLTILSRLTVPIMSDELEDLFGLLPNADDNMSLAYILLGSDDEEDAWNDMEEEMLLLFANLKEERKIKWQHDHLNWDEHVAKLEHEEEFDQTYRMSHESFIKLLNLVRAKVTPDIIKALNSAPEPIYPELVVAIGLRWLAGGSYADLKNVYGVSKTSVYRSRDTFVSAVTECEALRIRFLQLPKEIEKIRRQFERKSTNGVMRGCVGAMDGLLATMDCPGLEESMGNPRAYYSGHYNDYGFNVQAICDARLRFLFFAVAKPGGSSDLTAYERISIRDIIENLPDGLYIIADAAYMLTEHVLVPFTGGDRQAPDKDT